MHSILLLHEEQRGSSRIQDYVELSGYKVIEGDLECIANYAEILQAVDLILMECDEVRNYFEACEQLRVMTWLPIIVISRCGEEWEKIKMFQAGADDYLVTPYLQAELIARIHAHIERYRRLTRPFGIVEVRDLEINAINRQLRLRGKYIPLRVKEFDVLLYLAQRPNQIVTKEQIYREVWRDEILDGVFNTVAVHVKRVREKIETDIENPKYIETIWGTGYRFLG